MLSGTQITRVTSAKVQILTPEELQLWRTGMPTSATSTKTGSSRQRSSKVKPHTGTKVHILLSKARYWYKSTHTARCRRQLASRCSWGWGRCCASSCRYFMCVYIQKYTSCSLPSPTGMRQHTPQHTSAYVSIRQHTHTARCRAVANW